VDLSRTITTAGGSIAGVGVDDDSRALEVSFEILQQVTMRVSVFGGHAVEQQFPDIAWTGEQAAPAVIAGRDVAKTKIRSTSEDMRRTPSN
jgi:hypothetical protein